LAGTRKNTILAAWNDRNHSVRQKQIPPLWDGQAGARCREVLRQYFMDRPSEMREVSAESAPA